MIALKKKYQTARSDDAPALGNFIHYHFKQNNVKKKEVSDYLNVAPNTLTQYFKQDSFQFTILWRISKVVKHNFLMELGERLGIAYETQKEKELRAQLAEKEAEIKELTTQIGVYKQIHKIGS